MFDPLGGYAIFNFHNFRDGSAIAWLVSSPEVGGERASRSSPSAEEPRGYQAIRARNLESWYEAGRASLEQGDYVNAATFLGKAQRLQEDYRDLAQLVAHPEVAKIMEEDSRHRRYKVARSVYARRTVNIRSGPGTNHSIVRQAKAGEALKYETKEDSWFRLANLAGEPEWVHESVVMTQPERDRRKSADLQLLSWRWSSEYGYVTAEGQVRNVSGQSLKNVVVVIEWKTASGGFITSADCLIDYNPILPGQTSPFDCATTSNPAMKKASINFKTLLGGTLSWYKN